MAVNYAPNNPIKLRPATPGDIDYPSSDGEQMAETDYHVTLIAYVLAMLRTFFEGQEVYVGANMLVYYEEGDPTQRVAPDTFIVFGASPHKRRSWFTWKEGKKPDVIFEFTSRGTQSEDRWTKKGLYAWLGVQEYFLFDPLDEYLKPRLQGFNWVDGDYQAIPLVEGKLKSEMLGLTIGSEADMIKLWETKTGKELLPPNKETTARRAAEVAWRTAEARADAAEAEVTRLRAELERLKRKQ
ncbi:MAG: Uma2 family endonuclease [Chloroflexota bacterium]